MSRPGRLQTPASVATVSETMLRKPRIGLIRDFVEENWPSMDLVADMVFEHLEREHAATLQVTRICPAAPPAFWTAARSSGPRPSSRTPTG